MTDTITMDYHGKPLRYVTKEGEPWFVVSDLCRILSIYMRGGKPRTKEAMRRLRPSAKSLHPVETSCGPRLVGIVNRDGLFDLAFWAKQPKGPEWFVGRVQDALTA